MSRERPKASSLVWLVGKILSLPLLKGSKLPLLNGSKNSDVTVSFKVDRVELLPPMSDESCCLVGELVISIPNNDFCAVTENTEDRDRGVYTIKLHGRQLGEWTVILPAVISVPDDCLRMSREKRREAKIKISGFDFRSCYFPSMLG